MVPPNPASPLLVEIAKIPTASEPALLIPEYILPVAKVAPVLPDTVTAPLKVLRAAVAEVDPKVAEPFDDDNVIAPLTVAVVTVTLL